MEYIREIKVLLEKDSNKGNTKVGLSLGEYDENETVPQFIQRVKEYMDQLFLSEN